MRIQTILNRVEKFKPFVVGEASLGEHDDGPALIVIGKVAALDVASADGVNEALSAPTGVAVRARRTR